MTQGFNLPARLALKEVVNTPKSIWDTASDDANLDGLTLDFRMLKKIHRMRDSRADAYKGFIDNLQPASRASIRRSSMYPTYGFSAPNPQPSECASCLQNWKTDLLKKFEKTPDWASFSFSFHKGWTCGQCGQLMLQNHVAFETFITSQAAKEDALPELV